MILVGVSLLRLALPYYVHPRYSLSNRFLPIQLVQQVDLLGLSGPIRSEGTRQESLEDLEITSEFEGESAT